MSPILQRLSRKRQDLVWQLKQRIRRACREGRGQKCPRDPLRSQVGLTCNCSASVRQMVGQLKKLLPPVQRWRVVSETRGKVVAGQ